MKLAGYCHYVTGQTKTFKADRRRHAMNMTVVSVLLTRSSAIAERQRCSLFKLWQKYKCEKRASNTALCYDVNVDESSFYCSTAPCLYLMQN